MSKTESEEEKFKILNKTFILKRDLELENLASNIFNSYEIITEFHKFCNISEVKTSFLCSPKISSASTIGGELRSQQFKFQEVNWFIYNAIPYTSLTFPEEYKCPHGDYYKDIYIFFFSDHESTSEFMIKNIQRFKKLKAFI